MIEKDYILRLVQQLTGLIARLLALKSKDNREEMKLALYEGIEAAGLVPDAAAVDKAALDKIEDERVLAALSEAISVYLTVDDDSNLSELNAAIVEKLKAYKSLVYTTEIKNN